MLIGAKIYCIQLGEIKTNAIETKPELQCLQALVQFSKTRIKAMN